MKQLFTILMTLLCALSLSAQGKQDLKVLYVSGASDWQGNNSAEEITKRTKSFEEYLKNYFTTVKVVDSKLYTSNMSTDVDVTIFDGRLDNTVSNTCTRDEKGRIKDFYKSKSLPESFDYPAILIAENGENIGRGIGTKTDWYCLCLDADAHSTNFNHPIFKGPFNVSITTEEKPTPEGVFHYKYYYNGKIPQTIPMWSVQTKGYMNDKGFRIGMVSRPWGFLDSPDCESISSGVSAKTIDAVAIGRHGNFFFWGFSASPAYMTDDAKQVFANAIVYTASLKGEKIIARKYYDRAATREYVKEITYLASKEAYQERVESNKKFYEEQRKAQAELKAKKERGEELSKREESMLSMEIVEDEVSYDNYLKKQMRNGYYEMFKGDTKAFIKYMKENTPYLYGAAMFYQYIVDEDVKSLKIANNNVELLNKAITMLERGKEVEKAQRILDRYTLCTFTKPEQWRKWYNENKDKLFFTESGGWLFMVNTKDESVEGNNYQKKAEYLAAKQIELSEVDNNSPVAVGAKLITYHGGLQAIVVKFKIAPGYHIYANVAEEDPFIKTNVVMDNSENYKMLQAKIPSSKYYNENGTTVYENEAVFVLPLSGYGKEKLKVICEWQCCDSQICFPPAEQTIELETTLEKYN